MYDTNSSSTQCCRRPFTFRLRTLFLFTALISIPLGYIMYERRRCDQQRQANQLWMSNPIASRYAEAQIQIDLGEVVEDPSIPVRSGWTAVLLGDNSGDQIISFRRYFDNTADPSSRIDKCMLSHTCQISKSWKCEIATWNLQDSNALPSFTSSNLYLFQAHPSRIKTCFISAASAISRFSL